MNILINPSDNLTTTCYYDRKPNSIEGIFTVKTVDSKTNKIIKEITRIPARSGQSSESNSSWIRGKSPIPWTQESKEASIQKSILDFPKELWIWLRNIKQFGEWAGKNGIGEFRNISSNKTDPTTIQSPNNPKLIRKDIGLHPENGFKGSAGCIVLIADTEEQKQRILVLRQYLEELGKTQKHVRLVVL